MALSRFFSKKFNWLKCSINRIELFCSTVETTISEGDIVALDDTKIELAKDMLLSLRKITSVRLWVAMDRWFLCKELFQWLNSNNFDWVTKCKRNSDDW